MVTFGLAIVIQNLLQEIYTADPRSIDSGGLNVASVTLAEGFSVGTLPLLTFAIAVAIAAGMQALSGRTRARPRLPRRQRRSRRRRC